MKKSFKILATISAFICLPLISTAQQLPQIPQLPIDSAVRYGQLENGLTYYIRYNDLPKERAEFYIAQKVGSILEEENQRGLAHFLEHMAFNGTKNFPGKSMLDYLEKNGVKFGTNVNAYTSIDETVYNLSGVPTTNPGLIDSCLIILHDWSGFINLEDKDIDDERGVIHEEWRTRSNPFLRMYENEILPSLYPDNRYGVRMPIGLMEVVDNFPYEDLRDYYHKWYRPDLQAVVIVGDIDVDIVEARIKELWKDIPLNENVATREYFEIADNVEPLIGLATDKEATQNIISVMFKRQPLPKQYKNTQLGITVSLVNSMIVQMINERFEEIMQKPDAPFLYAAVDNGAYIFAKTKDAFTIQTAFKDGEWQPALKRAVEVVNSAKEYGFTASEYDRVKSNILSLYENAYNERDKVKNSQYVQEYVNNFLEDEPVPGIVAEYDMAQQILNLLPLEEINMALKQYITSENIAIMYMSSEKEGIVNPTKEEVVAYFQNVNKEEVLPYEDNSVNEPLISKDIKPGKIKTIKDGTFGTQVWTLSNGAKVIFKQTDFKTDQIMMNASSLGGLSLLPESDIYNSKVINQVITLGGLSVFSSTDLSKALSGKRASVAPYISQVSEGLNGSSTPKDFETMLQLTYLYFTDVRKDDEAYQSWLQRITVNLENSKLNPNSVINDSVNATLYAHNPKSMSLKTENLENIDYGRILNIYAQRFENAADFTFTFVGNIDPEQVKPLIEKYIASLPGKGKKENYLLNQPEIVSGQIENRFDVPMATPKVTVYTLFSGEMKYTLKNSIMFSMLDQIMDIVYTETIREQEGGTYGVSTRGGISDVTNRYSFYYVFDTGAEKVEILEKKAYSEFEKVAQNGPATEAFNKVKEYMVKVYNDSQKENGYWMGKITGLEIYGIDNHTTYLETLNSITPADIEGLAKDILSSGNKAEIVANGTPLN